MMHAWERKIVRVGALLLIVGALLFVGVLALNGFNFDRFARAVSYKRTTYSPEGVFDRLDVSVVNADVRLKPAQDGTCRVICDESGRGAYTVEVQDGLLMVRSESHWYDSIGINLSEPELTLVLPEKEYAQALIHSVSGDVDVGRLHIDALAIDTTSGEIGLENLTLGSLDVETVSGDVDVLDSVALDDVSIRTTSGEIELDNADGANFEITTVSGDVEGTLRSGKEFSIRSVSGDISAPESTPGGGAFSASTTSGEVKIGVK